MESATVLIVGIAAFIVGLTGFSIYTAFGPPSKNLDDPYEKHED